MDWMMRNFRWSLVAISTLVFVIVVASCSKKEVKQDEPLINPSGDAAEGQGATAPENTGAESTAVPSTTEVAPPPTSPDLSTIYFDFDSFRIRSDARESLKTNATWMKNNPNATVQIEGHCDERGTTEYNLALGEKRANSVRDFLTKLGISKSRISVISYGEERPSDPGHDESAWAKNRRAAFVVVSQ